MTFDAILYRTVCRYGVDPDAWHRDGEAHGWHMPRVSRWQRLPVIRRVLTWCLMTRLAWRSDMVWDGGAPPGMERELWMMWGLERGLWR